ESAVAVVVVEVAATMCSDDCYVEVTVVVVIEHGQAAAGAGLVQPHLRGDVVEFHGRRRKAALYYHPVLGWRQIGVAAHPLSRQPKPGTGALVSGVGVQSLTAHLRGSLEFSGAVQSHGCFVQRLGTRGRMF